MNEVRQRYGGGNRTSRKYVANSGMTLANITNRTRQYIVWLLYVALEFITKYQLDVENDVYLFLELCKYSKLEIKFRTLLDDLLKELMGDGYFLIQNPEEMDQKKCRFPITREVFKYEMDEWICSQISDDIRNGGDPKRISLFVDLYRVLTASDDIHLFQKIIYSLFFGDGTKKDLIYVPIDSTKKKIRNVANDISIMSFVQEAMSLSNMETRYLTLLFYIDQISVFRRFCVQCDDYQSEIFTAFLNITGREFNMLNRRSGNLRVRGFIMDDGFLDYDFREAVMNQSFDFFYNDIIKVCDLTHTYELSSFPVGQEKTDLLNCFLRGNNPCNILFYGAPGSGKTEFAKSIASENGLNAYAFLNEAELSTTRGLSKLMAWVSIRDMNKVLIIDEADKLLSTADNPGFFGTTSPSAIKGVVNKLLDQSNSKCIWIVNYDRNIDISTKRRFSISHHFDSMTELQLRDIASRKLEELHYDQKFHNKILDLFGKYKVTGASVDYVVKALKSIPQEKSLNYAEILLKENSELLYGRQKMRETIDASSYDVSVINTSISGKEIVQEVENARKYAIKHPDEKQGIRILFYGPSGTGKTELARYLSQKFGKPLCLKRCSDLFNKYVGGTEQNIAEAFAECERTGAILLFDEADSFFADRNMAEHSWERTQVNEFLTQLEEFSGIVICTTNLINIMDDAMYRRFNIRVEFKALSEDGVCKLLEKFYPDYEFTQAQAASIAGYDSATPGDFASLRSRIRFIDEENVDAEFIVEELVKMQKEKGGENSGRRCIGFRG